MSTEPESFLARWSRRKRAAERDAARPAGNPAEELPAPPVKPAGHAVTGEAPASASAVVRETASTTEVPLPPIESLDGLRSDYQAFFQQPVDDDLRHAALKKLFADPHFNQMDMLDVYVDDYTQFEPLPAELRLRLPSARRFLLDSEGAAPHAIEGATGATGDASRPLVVDPGAGGDAVAAAGVGDEACGVAGDDARIDSTSKPLLADRAAPAASAEEHRPSGSSSSSLARAGKATGSGSSSL